MNNMMENESVQPKTVKLTPTTPVYAMFDLVEIEGKQVVAGSIGFKDQFHMERMAKTAGEKGISNVGQHIVAIFAGQIDGYEPDEFTKEQLLQKHLAEAKEGVVDGTIQPESTIPNEPKL